MQIRRLPQASDYKDAVELQKSLSQRLILKGSPKKADFIAGVDCSSYAYSKLMVSAVTVWSYSQKEIIDSITASHETDFPYIPGLLAFREIPVILKAFQILETIPDVVICDGQGIAHMRGFGIACHLGLYLGLPTLGCGKSRLVGSYEKPDPEKGSVKSLCYKGKEVGKVVRTRNNVKPVFVSPGHLIGMNESVEIVLTSCLKYRLSEPIRAAHKLAGDTIRIMRDDLSKN
ncbi:endonuclease V [bacterium]|nr:endonuclease V [bacterium]